jgi:hypothetical protein
MAVSETLCAVLEKVGKAVDREWEKMGVSIAGKVGFEAIHIQSTRMSHPPFPIFCYALGCTPALSNGALLKMFDSFDPIACTFLNVNHSQTRKSRLTALAEKMLTQADVATLERAVALWDAKLKSIQESSKKKRKRTPPAEDALSAGLEGHAEEEQDDPPIGVTENFPGVTNDPVKAAARLVKECRTPARCIDFDEEARGYFKSLCVLANVNVKLSRDECDIDGGAMAGAGPWKLGQLAGMMLLWDIMWGDVVFDFRERQWLVKKCHVERAFDLMNMLDTVWSGFSPVTTTRLSRIHCSRLRT